MTKFWLLQYSVAGRTWFMMPDQVATKNKNYAQKFNTQKEAADYMEEFSTIWMYEPVETEFENLDKDQQPREAIV